MTTVDHTQKDQEKVIRAYRSKIKILILHTLAIYERLSTKQLSSLLGKSKTTILRNMENDDGMGLVDLVLVNFDEERSSGMYSKRVYSINSNDELIHVQKLKKQLKKNPELMLIYNNYRLSMFLHIRSVIDLSISYLKKMNKVMADNLEDVDELLRLRKDNLGALSYNYLTGTELKNLLTPASNRKKGDTDELHEYMRISMTVPIKRLIDMENKEKWEKDGTLWFYE